MQVMKHGFFLILGVAAQACGGGSDGGGGGGDGDGDSGKGGSSAGSSGSSNGGSSNGGSSNGGSSNGGSSSGGSSNGGSSNGGSAGTTAGTAGTGGACTGGTTNIYETPECQEFFSCIFDAACAQAGAQQQVCIDLLKQAFASAVPACVPSGDAATACDAAKADPSVGMAYPQCVD